MEMRLAAMSAVRDLSRRFDFLVPVGALREGFEFRGERVAFSSFYSGIHRPTQFTGPAALSLVTAPPKVQGSAAYDDEYDEATETFTYRFRDAKTDSLAALRAAERDNLAMKAAADLGVPLIYFRGISQGQYTPVAPIKLTTFDTSARLVRFQAGLPTQDTTPAGFVSTPDLRRYATAEVKVRLHQQHFREDVLRAYRKRCAVCTLRETQLLQAAHIIGDGHADGHAQIDNGISLCAIHHLAYDRNLLGIDPAGVVHISKRLLDEVDGPMLRTGLQGFHAQPISQPSRPSERPDPERLEVRFVNFQETA